MIFVQGGHLYFSRGTGDRVDKFAAVPIGREYYERKAAAPPSMPTTALAQTLADRYRLDVAEVDRILHTDDDCGKGWQGQKGHCVRSKVAHGAEHLTESAAGWAVGKFVGGAIAQVAASHGFPPVAAHLLSETAVQAIAATLIHARKAENRNPTDLAAKFITEAAAGFIGKSGHSGAHAAMEHIEGSAHAKAFGALIAGKAGGISTATAVSGIAHSIAGRLTNQSKALHALVTARVPVSRTDADSGTTDQLTGEERSALFDLTMAGWAIARHLKTSPKQDAMLTRTDATQTELDIYEIVGKDLQDATDGGIRYRSAEVTGKSRVEGVFTSLRDGKAYSFVWQAGKVTYQPVVAKTDSMSNEHHELEWLRQSIKLDNAGGSNRVDSLRLHLDADRKCGTGSYFCKAGGSGTCLGVHKSCSNDKQVVNHERLNKVNALIEHLNQGGEHPLRGLDKPGVEKLQGVANQIRSTRDLKAANLVAGRAGDRMAKAQQETEGDRRIAGMSQAEFIGNVTNPKMRERIAAEHTAATARVKAGDRSELDVYPMGNSSTRHKPLSVANPEKFKTLVDQERKEKEQRGNLPWQRTQEQVQSVLGMPPKRHEKEVESALKEGKDVPPHVLKDYPDLAAKYGTSTPIAPAPTTPATKPIASPQAEAARLAVMGHMKIPAPVKAQTATLEAEVAKRHAANVQALQGRGTAPDKSKGVNQSKKEKPYDEEAIKAARQKSHDEEVKAVLKKAREAEKPERAAEIAKMSVAQKLNNDVYGSGSGPVSIFESPEAMGDEPASAKGDWQTSADVIKKRYRRLANLVHPDKGGTEEQFNNLENAHSIVRTYPAMNAEFEAARQKRLAAKERKAAREAAKKNIEASPLAAQARSRTAGDLGDKGKHRHVSIDSVAGAIAKYRADGIRIDAQDAVAMLKGAENCGCDECQVKRKKKRKELVTA